MWIAPLFICFPIKSEELLIVHVIVAATKVTEKISSIGLLVESIIISFRVKDPASLGLFNWNWWNIWVI